VVSTAFIRDFLIGEADIASFSCYSKPPASAGGAFTIHFAENRHNMLLFGVKALLQFHERLLHFSRGVFIFAVLRFFLNGGDFTLHRVGQIAQVFGAFFSRGALLIHELGIYDAHAFAVTTDNNQNMGEKKQKTKVGEFHWIAP
jgi:hypothetical protein